MANVAHSTLTGSDLHENKGVAAATDDFVATATSSATVWKKLTASNLTGTGNSFGAQLLHVREQQNNGVTSTWTPVAGTFVTRVLNTELTNEISSASLASNQISLPAGTYFAEAAGVSASATGGNFTSQLRLYNITDSAILILGIGSRPGNASVTQSNECSLRGRFTLSGTKTVALQHYVSSGGTAPVTCASGQSEVYAELLIWKVA
jgi:hypothetical protein